MTFQFQIKKTKGGYDVYNTDTGKTFSKKPMTEENAKKQFRILNKYLYKLEGSGLNHGEIEENRKEALSDDDIKRYLPNVKIVSHQDLKNYTTIDQLLPKKKDLVIIIWETEPNFGHWTLIAKYIDEQTKQKTIEYFDSYGNKINEPLKWIRDSSIDSTPYIDRLLEDAKSKGYDLIYNSKEMQSENKSTSTCGRHCISRATSILNYNQSLSNYIKMLNQIKEVTGFNFDNIVSTLIK